MAKQTFTTGQVLTAAQMTSLQQTAMGGGSATAKTASYVLVAADAGTTVAMNAAGATTITVNTGLFAAGDTVFIQNLGAGACTVTAGTATVATAGSLILPQNDAGILYFTATGAAIFYDYIQAGAVSPLTTKGDLYTFSTSDARLGVGANGTTLVADSSEATGLKWAAAAGGAGITLIDEVAYSASTAVNVDNVFSATYKNYRIVITCVSDGASASLLGIRLRVGGSDTTTNYVAQRIYNSATTTLGTDVNPLGGDEWMISTGTTSSQGVAGCSFDLYNPFVTNNTTYNASAGYATSASEAELFLSGGSLRDSTSYTGFTLKLGNASTGSIFVYGYAKE